jgi:hypothetical protein
MAKTRGRYDDESVELDDEGEGELELEVKDWKPHMGRVISHAFQDPSKIPR